MAHPYAYSNSWSVRVREFSGIAIVRIVKWKSRENLRTYIPNIRYCSLAISCPRRHPFVVVIYDKACKMYVFSSRGESQPLLHALCEGPCIQYIEETLMHLQICDARKGKAAAGEWK
jgi:hypothetical protein